MTKTSKRENHRIKAVDRRPHEKTPPRREARRFLTNSERERLTLFILRHGEAGARITDAAKDSDRALTANGRTEIEKIGRSLKESGLKPRRVITSPLRRARETAEIISHTLKIPATEEWEDLRPDGNRESVYQKLARIEEGTSVVLVGHEPYLTSMIGEIIEAPHAQLVLKKGGLAKVRVTSFAPRVRGELCWLLTPKLMSRMS